MDLGEMWSEAASLCSGEKGRLAVLFATAHAVPAQLIKGRKEALT